MKSLLSLLSLLCLTAAASAQTILAQPYLQPGPQGALEATDEMRVIWVTDQTPGRFTVEYAPKGFKPITAKVEVAPMDFPAPVAKTPVTQEKDQHYIRYTAALPGLLGCPLLPLPLRPRPGVLSAAVSRRAPRREGRRAASSRLLRRWFGRSCMLHWLLPRRLGASSGAWNLPLRCSVLSVGRRSNRRPHLRLGSCCSCRLLARCTCQELRPRRHRPSQPSST